MKTPVDWNVDQLGRILGPRLHDSYLFGVSFFDGQALNLKIRNIYKDVIDVDFLGISDINIAQLCNGTIISDIYLWKVNDAPKVWNVPDCAWNILLAERCGQTDAKEKANKIIQDKPDMLLVCIECSYGGAIAAICEEVAIFKQSSD